jgi:hypothetical protein
MYDAQLSGAFFDAPTTYDDPDDWPELEEPDLAEITDMIHPEDDDDTSDQR